MTDRAPSPAGRRRPPLWRRLLGVVVVVGVFGGGALMLADYLAMRKEVSEGIGRRMALSRAPEVPEPGPGDSALLRAWTPEGIAWRKAREVPFGEDRAWFVSGMGSMRPQDAFGAVLRTWEPLAPVAGRDLQALGEITAAGLMRMSVTVGQVHGLAFLSRVPPDLEAFGEGRFAFEPGGAMVAYPRDASTWEYVTWYFPDGLDLGAFMQQWGAPKGVLDRVAAGVEEHLEPALVIGPDPLPVSAGAALTAGTVYCRARGTGASALRGAGAAFERAGWRTIKDEVSRSGHEVRILASDAGNRSVWITTSQREQEGGFVTVQLGSP